MRAVFAIIVGAGKGERLLSDTPKQFLSLGHKTVFERSFDVLNTCVKAKNIVCIIPKGSDACIFPQQVDGGNTRQESVFIGLEWLKKNTAIQDDDIVLIHDAARPFVKEGDIKNLIVALQTQSAATLASPLSDSLRHKKPV